jgi:uncharacterized protein (TIGR04222 family)
MNPFDWSGPVFLQAYIASAVVGIILAIYWRYTLSSRRLSENTPELHPYEIAHLVGGAARSVDTALARLLEGEVIDYQGKLFARRAELPRDAHPLEKILYNAMAQPCTIGDLRKAASGEVDRIRERLERLRLEMTDAELARSRWLPVLPLVLVVLAGIIKIVIGVEREKPVGFLILGSVILGIVAVVFLRGATRLTSLGAEVLERYRAQHASLRVVAEKAPMTLAGPDLTMAVCLFGPIVLASTPYLGWQSFMHGNVTPGGSSFYGSSCGSTCGDTGSSCGGGDGGGSSCGGGCGGCGGGD